MSSNEIDQMFSYDGQLIFRTLELPSEPKQDVDRFVEKLSESDRNLDRSDGIFRQRNLDDPLMGDFKTLDEVRHEMELLQFVQEVHGPETTILTEGGDRVQGQEITERTADCVFLPNGRVLIRGPRMMFQSVNQRLNAAVETSDRLNRVELKSHFLLWLLWKYHQKESLEGINNPLQPVSLNVAQIETADDALTETTKYSGDGVVQSSLFLIDLLRGGNIQALGGVFKLGNRFIEMNINLDSSIHVQVSEALGNLPDIGRYLLAVQATDRIVEQYQKWEHLPKKKKYPPKEFFMELKEELSDSGVDANFSLIDAVAPILELRGEELG